MDVITSFTLVMDLILCVDIDECGSAPCLHGATCNDYVNMYNCTCVPGYNGTHCEVGRWDKKNVATYMYRDSRGVTTIKMYNFPRQIE